MVVRRGRVKYFGGCINYGHFRGNTEKRDGEGGLYYGIGAVGGGVVSPQVVIHNWLCPGRRERVEGKEEGMWCGRRGRVSPQVMIYNWFCLGRFWEEISFGML